MRTQFTVLAIVFSSTWAVAGYDMVPRWGQASLYIASPPTLFIHGGKTASSGQTYSSAPTSSNLIRLPLSSNFTTSSPPFEVLDTPAPFDAWQTLSLLGGNRALLFGGNGGSSLALPGGTDSSWLLNLGEETVSATQQSAIWANQPSRRIYHSSATHAEGGTVYITGGQRNDGSGIVLDDVYAFDPSSNVFRTLPSLPRGTAHHVSLLLPNGTLVVFGGAQTSVETGNPILLPMFTVYSLDTAGVTSGWSTVNIGGSLPPARRGSSVIQVGGDRAVILGGADVNLSGPLGDMWEINLRDLSWTRITDSPNAPSPRFDLTAVNVGNNQMLVFGGYGPSGPADASTYLYDTASRTWTTAFIAAAPNPSSNPPSPSNPASQTGTNTPNPLASGNPPGMSASRESSFSINPSGSASSSSESQTSGGGLSTSAQIALALGVIAGLGVIAALALICLRRRRRRHVNDTAALLPLGPGEKGLPLAPLDPPEWSEKGGIIGLGLSAYGSGLVRNSTSQYASLQGNEDLYVPPRRPTRKLGEGIRLIGPRDNPSALIRSPPPAPSQRMNMLSDEDSRSFTPSASQDWKVHGRNRESWRTATSVLGHGQEGSDPFEDDELLPPIRGGPVPTPTASINHLNPFHDEQNEIDIGTSVCRSSGPGLYQLPPVDSEPLDLAGLLSGPSSKAYNNDSFNRSEQSRGSLYLSEADMEEGVVQHARVASHATPSILSPGEGEYVPMRRNESFFRRMATGGISSLLTGSGRTKGGVRRSESFDIRDPAPEPALWPVYSRELHEGGGTGTSTPTSSATTSHPPSAWQSQSGAGAHLNGPSLSSLTSAKSMRDMVIVKREGTDSTEASIDVLDRNDIESEQGTPGPSASSSAYAMGGYADELLGSTSRIPPNSSTAPGLVDSPIDLYPSRTLASIAPAPSSSGSNTLASPSLAASDSRNASLPSLTLTATPSSSPSTKRNIPEPPSGSPLPKQILEHRRPVKDMVFSINKRSSGVFVDAVSPTSQYSASPGGSPLVYDAAIPLSPKAGSNKAVEGGSRVSWEVRKRGSLMVANPDKKSSS